MAQPDSAPALRRRAPRRLALSSAEWKAMCLVSEVRICEVNSSRWCSWVFPVALGGVLALPSQRSSCLCVFFITSFSSKDYVGIPVPQGLSKREYFDALRSTLDISFSKLLNVFFLVPQ